MNEIKTLENARFEYSESGVACMALEVNGRPCLVYREQALRLDGEIAQLGPWDDWQDFFVIIEPSEKHGIQRFRRLTGYTRDENYVALVWRFVEAIDSGTFRPGPLPEG